MGKQRNTTTPSLTDEQKKQVRRDNFTRVLPPRMDKAVKAIRMVADCTNATYLYTTKQADFIISELQQAVDTVKSRFSGEPGKSGGFELPS